jgi:hypothetical protein
MAKIGQSFINYGHMPLERCIEEKPDVADVIRCQDYCRNSPNDRNSSKKEVQDAMPLESQRLDTSVPNGNTRLRTFFSNSMMTMKKLQHVWRRGCSEADDESDGGGGEPPDESAAGGGGDSGEEGGAGGPAARNESSNSDHEPMSPQAAAAAVAAEAAGPVAQQQEMSLAPPMIPPAEAVVAAAAAVVVKIHWRSWRGWRAGSRK